MSWHWLENEDVRNLTEEQIESCGNDRDIWHLWWAWKYRHDDTQRRLDASLTEAARLARRTSELTAQIEALTEELYQERHK